MPSNIDIEQLKRLHAAATPGEWQRHPSREKWVLLPIPQDADPNNDANAEFCVFSHNALPALIAALEAAEAKVEEQEAQIEALELDGEEYEKDCKKALVSLASAFNYEWDGDGATADELREFIQETVRLARDRAAAMQWRCPKCGIGPRDEKGDS